MPPKKIGSIKKKSIGKKSLPEVSQSQRNALTSMFKKIESRDSNLKECSLCSEKIKECLFNDHLNTKCPKRVGIDIKNEPGDIIFVYSNAINNNIIHKKIKTENDIIKNDPDLEDKPAKNIKLETKSLLITTNTNIVIKTESTDLKSYDELKSEPRSLVSETIVKKCESHSVKEEIIILVRLFLILLY